MFEIYLQKVINYSKIKSNQIKSNQIKSNQIKSIIMPINTNELAINLKTSILSLVKEGLKFNQSSIHQHLERFFLHSVPQIRDASEQGAIVKKCLLYFHPDKITETDPLKDQYIEIFYLMQHALQKIRKEFSAHNTTLPTSYETDSLTGSVFGLSEAEDNITRLIRLTDSQLLKDWLRSKPYDAPVLFMKNVLKMNAWARLYTISVTTLILRIALLESLVQNILPTSSVKEYLAQIEAEGLCVFESDLGPESFLRKDPLLWLCQELVLRHCVPHQNLDPGQAKELSADTLFPQYIDIFRALYLGEEYPNQDELEILLKKWSSGHLPGIKALFQQHLADFKYIEKHNIYKTNINKVKFDSVQKIVTVKSDSYIYYKINFLKSALENPQKPYDLAILTFFREKIYELIMKLPPDFLMAQWVLETGENIMGYRPLGLWLSEMLDKMNMELNKERASLKLALEDPQFQPCWKIESYQSFVHFFTANSPIQVSYMDIPCIDNIITFVPMLSNIRGDYREENYHKIPQSVHPAIASVIFEWMRLFKLSPHSRSFKKINTQYAEVIDPEGLKEEITIALAKLPKELRENLYTKGILLAAIEVIAEGHPKRLSMLNNCIEQNIGNIAKRALEVPVAQADTPVSMETNIATPDIPAVSTFFHPSPGKLLPGAEAKEGISQQESICRNG